MNNKLILYIVYINKIKIEFLIEIISYIWIKYR